MLRLYRESEIREREMDTIQRFGLPSLVLMERAALSMMPFLRELNERSKILIVCGTGNNGGDGLALARLLYEKKRKVTVCYPGSEERATKENRTQLAFVRSLEIPIIKEIPFEHYDAIVDCLLGIGLSRDIEGVYREIIESINEKAKLDGSVILSADIPSGIHADTGEVMGIAVKATGTVCFGFAKLGCYIGDGPKYCGHIVVRNIGIISDHFPKVNAFTYKPEELASVMTSRDPYGNKGTFGKVLCICGSEDVGGAAILSAKAALKSGAGMVKVLSSEKNRDILLKALPEAMFGVPSEIELLKSIDWCSVCIIGPGISLSEKAGEMVRFVLKNCDVPVIVDADAITLLAEHHECIAARHAKGYLTILTPHPGEFSRYFGESIKHKRYKDPCVVMERAEKEGIILVSKDHRTLVSDGKRLYVNTTGSDAMATAGSGDVLTGVIASQLCVHSDPFDAVAAGVFLHGLGGDRAALDKGNHFSVTASNIITGMEFVLKDTFSVNPSNYVN